MGLRPDVILFGGTRHTAHVVCWFFRGNPRFWKRLVVPTVPSENEVYFVNCMSALRKCGVSSLLTAFPITDQAIRWVDHPALKLRLARRSVAFVPLRIKPGLKLDRTGLRLTLRIKLPN